MNTGTLFADVGCQIAFHCHCQTVVLTTLSVSSESVAVATTSRDTSMFLRICKLRFGPLCSCGTRCQKIPRSELCFANVVLLKACRVPLTFFKKNSFYATGAFHLNRSLSIRAPTYPTRHHQHLTSGPHAPLCPVFGASPPCTSRKPQRTLALDSPTSMARPVELNPPAPTFSDSSIIDSINDDLVWPSQHLSKKNAQIVRCPGSTTFRSE